MKAPVNRILFAFRSWEELKSQMQPLLATGVAQQRSMDRLQLNHLRTARLNLRGEIRGDERPFLMLLHQHIRKLEKQLYPNFLVRMLMRLKQNWVDRPRYLRHQQARRSRNLEQLKAQLKALGLSGTGNFLEKQLEPEQKSVSLPLQCQFGAESRIKFDLQFERDPNGDFELSAIGAATLGDSGVIRSHQFKPEEWPNFSIGQAWHLLEGRALKQQFTDVLGDQGQRWVQLGKNGPEYFDPLYPFYLPAELDKLPVTFNKTELTKYLENGQQVPTHWRKNGEFQKIYVQADPASRSIQLFDEKRRPVTAEQLNERAIQLKARSKTNRQRVQNGRRHKSNQSII